MAYTKIYLKHILFRRGSPVLVYVTKDTDSEKNSYCLGVYHDLIPFKHLKRGVKNLKHYKGIGQEYNACQKISISKGLYSAFIKEAKANQNRIDKSLAEKKKYFRKCRVCGSSKRIGKPCVICAKIKATYEALGKSSKRLSMKLIISRLRRHKVFTLPLKGEKKNG